MNFEQYKDRAFEYALAQGAGAAEIYFFDGGGFEAVASDGELDKYSVSHEYGLTLRVQVEGKDGYAYTEALDDPESLCKCAIDNAKTIENGDESPMCGKCEYPAVEYPEQPLAALSEDEKIDLALRLEKAALAADDSVKRVMYCTAASGHTELRIVNTLGMDARRKSDIGIIYLMPVLQEGEVVKDGFAFRTGVAALNVDGCAKEAAEIGASRFGADSVPSGEYRILLKNTAVADLLDAFSPMFCADNAQKGLSLFAGKEGQRIAADSITILNDPLYKDDPRPFDAEGVPSVTTAVVERGVLRSLLHDLKTAKKAGVSSTSSAGRARPFSPIEVAPCNLHIQAGEDSYEALLAELGDGLVIDELVGLHAGVDSVSGEFSLLAQGHLVKDGRIVRAVEQVTVGGSFIDMMMNVLAVGCDLRFGMPGDSGCGGPSLLISGLMVAGE